MENTAGLPLLHQSDWPPDVERIVEATRAECRDLRAEGDRGASISADAAETILGLIGIHGVPVLDGSAADLRRTWLWADLHLHDAASVRHHRRPFWGWPTHDRALRRRWRNSVGPSDLMIHVGDFAPESIGERRRRALLDTLPGRKVNVLGNHDVAAVHAPLTDGWDATFGALVVASNPALAITHCPLRNVPAGAVNVHGHMHRRRDRRSGPWINVAVEQTGYHPVQASALVTEATRRLKGFAPVPLCGYGTAAPAGR